MMCSCSGLECAIHGCARLRVTPPHSQGIQIVQSYPAQTMGCVCPGDATMYCQNQLCPRKPQLFNERPAQEQQP